MTFLKFINRYVVQWLGFRITRTIGMTGKTIGYGLLIGVVPTTGWSTDYKGPCWKLQLYGDK